MSAQRAADNPLAGAANMRGGLLIAVAVIVGVVLLGKGFDTGVIGSSGGDPSDEAATGGDGSGDEGSTGDGSTDATTTTTLPLRTPAEVRVQVLNGGATVNGSAGAATEALSTATYNVLAAANADADVAATTVFAAAGYEADAAAIAAALGIAAPPVAMPAPPPPPAPADINVVVVLGPDFTPPAAAN